MNLRHSSLACALTLGLTGTALADSYTIDGKHTFPSFEVSHIGFSTQRGRFDRTSGKINLDEKAKTGSIEVSIEADSIDTGLQDLEDKLKSAEFFNTASHPTITYTSDKLVFSGNAPVAAEGRLNLLGVEKPVRLAIDHFHCGVHPINKKNVCGADASATIKRSDFGLSAFIPAIGDEVKIKIQVEAFKD